MWLEDMVLRKGEKKLQSYRLEAEGLKSSPSYLNYVPRIQSALSTARYWHGTGRYHYKDPTDVVDILTSIINDDGLKPHLDPWLDSGGKTVSLGTTRMHSRLFARVHLNERDTLVYELGSVRYWIRLYAVLLLFWLLTNLRSHREFIKKLFRRASIKEIQNRIHLL
ncbi:MAG: hypothetical protein JWO84_655, partial [Parcubacteria group bacterium]|nr:hypothetical protein [Parcubacteria group bacterium]